MSTGDDSHGRGPRERGPGRRPIRPGRAGRLRDGCPGRPGRARRDGGAGGRLAGALNLVGHDSHGVIRLVQYAGWVADGQIRPAALPEVSRRHHAIAVIDGHWGFGQAAAQLAVDVVSRGAQENGVAAAAIRDCNHVGRLGEYVTGLADENLVGLSFCNAGSDRATRS